MFYKMHYHIFFACVHNSPAVFVVCAHCFFLHSIVVGRGVIFHKKLGYLICNDFKLFYRVFKQGGRCGADRRAIFPHCIRRIRDICAFARYQKAIILLFHFDLKFYIIEYSVFIVVHCRGADYFHFIRLNSKWNKSDSIKSALYRGNVDPNWNATDS